MRMKSHDTGNDHNKKILGEYGCIRCYTIVWLPVFLQRYLAKLQPSIVALLVIILRHT